MSNKANRQPHHIYTEVLGKTKGWIPADATYSSGIVGKRENETFRESWSI